MNTVENLPAHISYKTYIAGFIISLLFTVLAFVVVMQKLVIGNSLVAVLLLFAVAQASTQMVFFMHLGTKNRWNLSMFVSTVGLVFIIVVGSLWIMKHLNYNMSAEQMDARNLKMEGMRRE